MNFITSKQAMRSFETTAVARLGEDHSCAINKLKELWCWGFNKKGQLGTRSTQSSSVPAKLSIPNQAAKLASGWRHSCVIDTLHKIYYWGWNKFGQLGNGKFKQDKYTPTEITFGFDDSGFALDITIGAGSTHTCLMDNGGAIWCLGNNEGGQLGIGNNNNKAIPTKVSGITATLLGSGRAHTCAKTSSGLVCWGDNTYGQLGTGDKVSTNSPTSTSTPIDVQGLALGVSTLLHDWN